MYKINFEDGTEFQGGPVGESKWNDMPKKWIKSLTYTIKDKEILLEGFEEYNHIVEHVNFIQKHGKLISQLILMGKKNNDVYKVILNFSTGKVSQEKCLYGTEYNGRKVLGWKNGIINRKAQISLK